MDNKQKKILAKKNIIINKNYLSNLPPSSRQVILKNKIIKNNPNNTKGITNMNKKIKYNHKNKFTSSNINDNFKEKLIKKENNSLEELKNKKLKLISQALKLRDIH